jgi:hypothetical protein
MDLQELESLDSEWNSLTELEPNLLFHWSNLKSISFSYNQIVLLNSSEFLVNNKAQENIKFAYNSITKINECIFFGLNQLQLI